MKLLRRITALLLVLLLVCSAASALAKKSKATPTPAPVEIDPDVSGEIPAQIQVALDAAYDAWKEVDGKRLKDVNQFTKWRNNYPYKWCGGFVTWCMIQGDLPMAEFGKIKEGEVEGLYHCKEAMPSKMATGYLKMNRSTKIPRKGFVICYGNKSTKFWHVGIVDDIEMLPDGKYRLTTIEGDVQSTVKMFIYDYDPYAEKNNLTLVPKEERTKEETKNFSYKAQWKSQKLYVSMFYMPWIPGENGSED